RLRSASRSQARGPEARRVRRGAADARHRPSTLPRPGSKGEPLMQREPLAFVGIGCRIPGDVESAEDLREMLRAGKSAIRDVPAERWDRDAFFHPDFQKPGSIHVRRGGFISDVEGFDASFFGISPNEAKRMDPQQRLVLETAFRAVEDAGE